MKKKSAVTCTYSVSGTHCHSCELLIEKEISRLPGVKSVSASTVKKSVTVTSRHPLALSQLNHLFKSSCYVFSDNTCTSTPEPKTDIFLSLLIVSGVLILAFVLSKLGVFSNFNVNSDSLLSAFFFFGLLAGLSTCAALVGGIVLSLSRQWQSLYSQSDSTFTRLQPALIFNLGRLVFFAVFGAVLGYFGSFFHLSLTVGAIVTILVSLLMLLLGLQMLGVKALASFQLSLPKSITRRFTNEADFNGKYMPFVMGGLTFFLPCGFTLTAQSLALASGDVFQGALIMFFFALGTFLPLLLIGYSSVASQKNPATAKYFSQVAGLLVILFSLYNLSSQSTVLGFSFPTIPSTSASDSTAQLVPVVNGQQVIRMDASSSGYRPNYFQVKAGLPIRWEITDRGTSGCTNAVISRQLFEGQINLVPGTTSIREFIAPTTPGTYRFSCWMGMISGTIEVVL